MEPEHPDQIPAINPDLRAVVDRVMQQNKALSELWTAVGLGWVVNDNDSRRIRVTPENNDGGWTVTVDATEYVIDDTGVPVTTDDGWLGRRVRVQLRVRKLVQA